MYYTGYHKVSSRNPILMDKKKQYVVGNNESGQFLIDKESGEVKGFNFTKVDMSVIPSLYRLISDHPKAAELLFYLWVNMDRANHFVASQSRVVSESGLSKSTVIRSKRVLESRNYIEIRREHGETHWYLNERVSWRKREGDKLSVARFDSGVL